MEEKRALIKYEADQIKERNLNKQELEISIYSPMFATVVQGIEKRIKACMVQVHDEEFESGRITVTLDIMSEEKENPEPILDSNNQVSMRPYKAPHIKSNITLKLVRKDQDKSDTTFDMHEIVLEGDKFIAKPVKTAQMSLDDVKNEQQVLEDKIEE